MEEMRTNPWEDQVVASGQATREDTNTERDEVAFSMLKPETQERLRAQETAASAAVEDILAKNSQIAQEVTATELGLPPELFQKGMDRARQITETLNARAFKNLPTHGEVMKTLWQSQAQAARDWDHQ